MLNADYIKKSLRQSFDKKKIFIKSKNKTIHFHLMPYQQVGLIMAISLAGIWLLLSTSFLAINHNFTNDNTAQNLSLDRSYQTRLNLLAQERNQKEAEINQLQRQFYSAVDEISKSQSIYLKNRKQNEELEKALKALQEIINNVEIDDLRHSMTVFS